MIKEKDRLFTEQEFPLVKKQEKLPKLTISQG